MFFFETARIDINTLSTRIYFVELNGKAFNLKKESFIVIKYAIKHSRNPFEEYY